ncbi:MULTISPECIES: carbohydrate ABC transporter permease [unclassified Microbacterium]|uniref:carbohydrate ABC transporter permease n=1 Tax=unclassified Microbacterium TaxID=2609290 RepID=UPI0016054DAE|nr:MULTISPECIES: sugar ABC transporter permease [unclassified Microbacterium]QNA93970.1 sugar ABC transporter permease [Microbacterium sp. Se63.02b]QYM64294.1 sugar ABC transporter permease [Microbacterium sp. Se5.02b]
MRSASVMLAPALVLFIVFVIVPVGIVIGLGFFDWSFFNTPAWVGLENFKRLFSDGQVYRSLGITALFALMGVAPTVALGFMLAVLVNVRLPGIGLLRLMYFAPIVVSVSVSAVLWRFIYDGDRGPLAALGTLLGVEIPSLLNTTSFALPAIVVMMIWTSLPLAIIFYLAALQRVPEDIYAAAALDGAGRWRTMWQITWPNVASTTVVVAMLQVVGFTAGSLDFALVTTNGGPLDSTTSLGLFAYKAAFVQREVGYSSAASLLQIAVIAFLALVAWRAGAGRTAR